jgi:hypothetical protein
MLLLYRVLPAVVTIATALCTGNTCALPNASAHIILSHVGMHQRVLPQQYELLMTKSKLLSSQYRVA